MVVVVVHRFVFAFAFASSFSSPLDLQNIIPAEEIKEHNMHDIIIKTPGFILY